MNNTNRKRMVKTSVIALLTLGISATASAAPTSAITSATTTLDVSLTKTATIKLDAEKNLSGASTRLATGSVESTDSKVAFRWATGEIRDSNKTISNHTSTDGKSKSALLLVASPQNTVMPGTHADGWIIGKENKVSFHIGRFNNEKLNVGSYPITVEAVAWGN